MGRTFGDSTNDEMLAGFVDYLVEKPQGERPIAKLDPAIYDAYVGDYLKRVHKTWERRHPCLLGLAGHGRPPVGLPRQSSRQGCLRSQGYGEVTGFVFEMGNRTMQAKKAAAGGQKQQ